MALLERVLKVASERGLGYWEATDLEVDIRATLESDWLQPVRGALLPGVTRVQPTVPSLASLAHNGSSLLLADEGRRIALILEVGETPMAETKVERGIVAGARSRNGTWALLSRLIPPESGCELLLLRPDERGLESLSPPVRHGMAAIRVAWLGEPLQQATSTREDDQHIEA